MLFLVSCTKSDFEESKNRKYIEDINNWHSRRIENLKKETGWLNLAGLFWLKEGENTFGSDKSNDIVFPEEKAERFIGKIVKNDTSIFAAINSGIDVKKDGIQVTKIEMLSDISGNPTILSHRSLKWFVIKRDKKYGIRLRDLESDLLDSFSGIERFPIQDKWKIEAKFVEYSQPKRILIPSIIGTVSEEHSPGRLVFTLDNKEYSLEPLSSGDNLFIVFADQTSGEETYGAGRFLYAEGPNQENKVTLDFNKAYNPPCAFTKYATCPLPPEENKIDLRITAGEKVFKGVH
jgi:uncharacterized protein (DUF1684 family)